VLSDYHAFSSGMSLTLSLKGLAIADAESADSLDMLREAFISDSTRILLQDFRYA
jgi:hypothetical protein